MTGQKPSRRQERLDDPALDDMYETAIVLSGLFQAIDQLSSDGEFMDTESDACYAILRAGLHYSKVLVGEIDAYQYDVPRAAGTGKS